MKRAEAVGPFPSFAIPAAWTNSALPFLFSSPTSIGAESNEADGEKARSWLWTVSPSPRLDGGLGLGSDPCRFDIFLVRDIFLASIGSP